MTPQELAPFRKKLLELREELLGKRPHKIEPNRTSDAEVGEDEDEQPLNEMLQAIASNRNRSTARTLQLVDKALKKMAERPDDYGLCEGCDEDLEEGRLNAAPYVELCVDCAAKREGAQRPSYTRRSLLDFK